MAGPSKKWLMTGILQGLQVTLKHILQIGDRGTVTVQYPYERMSIEDRYRGLHAVDENKCIGCGICEMNCPNGTISIVRHGKWYPEVKLGQCMFCGLCVDACPMDAMKMTKEFELATYNKESMVYGPERLLFK